MILIPALDVHQVSNTRRSLCLGVREPHEARVLRLAELTQLFLYISYFNTRTGSTKSFVILPRKRANFSSLGQIILRPARTPILGLIGGFSLKAHDRLLQELNRIFGHAQKGAVA